MTENKLFYPILFIIVAALIFVSPAMGVDFIQLYPAGRAVLSLENPYEVATGFYNPPWMLLFLTPISLFKVQFARWIWFFIGVALYFTAFKRLKFDNVTILMLFCSPFLYFDLGAGNFEWLILLGATLASAQGSWIMILKPQSSIGLFLLWGKQRKWLVLLPVTVLFALIAFDLYGFPSHRNMYWSADIFPWGIPVGLWLGYLAMKRDDKLLALAASPFLSPYVAVQSWIFILLPLTRSKKWLGAVVGIGWIGMILFTSHLHGKI